MELNGHDAMRLVSLLTLGGLLLVRIDAWAAQVSEVKVAQAVVFLRVPSDKKPGEIEIGSGFLVNFNNKLFLTTAAHVAGLMSAKSSITLGIENDAAMTIALSDLTGGDPKWVLHPVADVGVLLLHPAAKIESILTGRALPSSIFITKLEAPARDRPLTIVGFPLGLGVLYTGPGAKISSIQKESKAASGLLTLPRSDTKKPTEFFVLDSPSVGGFSGAPVFVLPAAFSKGSGIAFSSTTLFVGLVHGTLSDSTGGKFAVVVPSAFVTQTIDRAYEAEP